MFDPTPLLYMYPVATKEVHHGKGKNGNSPHAQLIRSFGKQTAKGCELTRRTKKKRPSFTPQQVIRPMTGAG